MHRIDTPGNVDGKFVVGSPQTGQKPTRLGADWPNSVQEEIASLIEFVGLALNKNDTTQLRQALSLFVAGAVGSGGGSVPTTRQVNGGGLVTGGGPLAANLTLSVLKATLGEVSAQVRDDVAVTPAGLAGIASLTGSGGARVLRVGSARIMFASGVASANTSTLITLPDTFPTTCFAAFANGGEQAASADDNPCFANGWGTNYVSVFSAVNFSVGVNVVAFGY